MDSFFLFRCAALYIYFDAFFCFGSYILINMFICTTWYMYMDIFVRKNNIDTSTIPVQNMYQVAYRLLRGSIVIRTHHVPKHPYIPYFLHTILGPDYYVCP